ncbi:MAG: hypothetical protein HY741_13180 [Chloroflexi bacterium]|nr:hypothetical protein [Chloroflexota bacterium]
MQKWYVLSTKLHAERQVASHLLHAGGEVYLPMIPVAQPRRDRPVDRPFFPGYLFVRYDLEQLGVSKLRYTPGLRGVVMFGGEPAVVADADVARVRAQLAKPQMWDKSGTPLEPGDPVEILQEPFQDLDAVFDRRLTPTARVRVFLRYLERHELARKSVEHLIPLELDGNLVRKKETRR